MLNKRLPITAEERMFVKSIESTAVVVLLMFKIYPTPINTDSLAFEMKWDSRKAKKMLDDLSSDGFTVLMKGQGYVLTPQARGMVVEFFGNLIALPLESQALAQGNKAQALSPVTVAGTETVGSEQSSSTHTLRVLKKIEEDSLILNNSDSSSNSKSAQNVQPLRIGNEIEYAIANGLTVVPTIMGVTDEDGVSIYRMEVSDGSFVTARDILTATEDIDDFGDIPLHVLPVDAIKPELALAWVAKAYDDRKQLHNAPAGLVVSRLRNVPQSQPPRRYFRNPAKYLPDEYCERLRLKKYDCKSCVGQVFSTREAFEAHVQLMHAIVEEIAPEFVIDSLDSDHPGSKAWESVKFQLMMEMPRASFDTWVRDTYAVAFDGQVLTVGVRNAYARDWLESRLKSQVNQLLNEIPNGVSVEFVVADVSNE